MLLACGASEPPAPYPDAQYLAAMGQELPDAAGLICEDIGAGPRRGECFFFAAREAGWPEGLFLCDEGTWSDLCRFELIDHGGLIGDEAREQCASTGDFEASCRAHALQRDLEAHGQAGPPWHTEAIFAAWGVPFDPTFEAALHAATGEPCVDHCELVETILLSWSGETTAVDDDLGRWRMRERPRWMREHPPR